MNRHDQSNQWENARILGLIVLFFSIIPSIAWAAPPRLSIFHFDVNTGDATLIISPDGHGVLIDAGDQGRGLNPIREFLDHARRENVLTSLDYVISTHYDADHIGGMDEVLTHGWYPEISAFDRGNSFLPPFDRQYVQNSCHGIDPDQAEQVAPWGTAPTASCPLSRRASCRIIDYFLAAEDGGRRMTIQPGQTLILDHGLELVALVVNAQDIDGESVPVHFPGRRQDCASNDLSVGILVRFGDFRYLVAGDLTGDPSEGVADVEGLIADDATDLDVYHVNHHGSATSSSPAFMQAIHPTVAIVSNGRSHNHPNRDVVQQRLLALDPPPALYLTNFNRQANAWNDELNKIADLNFDGYDGMIELAVWRRSYRVYRWRDGSRIDGNERYMIKRRN